MKELSINETEAVVGGFFFVRGSTSNWLSRVLGNLNKSVAKDRYREYRARRDRDNSPGSRARARSRSDMNSPGDQRSSDRIGGR